MLVARRRLPLLARSLASPASSWITRTTCATRRTASTAASPASETGIQVADPLLLYFSLGTCQIDDRFAFPGAGRSTN